MSAFKKLVGKLEAKGLPEKEAKGTAANIGRAKYGEAEMARKSAAGRAKAAGHRKSGKK